MCFESLPTFFLCPPCDCCLWHGAEVQALHPPTALCMWPVSFFTHSPPPMLIRDSCNQFVAAEFRLPWTWQPFDGSLAIYRPDVTCYEREHYETIHAVNIISFHSVKLERLNQCVFDFTIYLLQAEKAQRSIHSIKFLRKNMYIYFFTCIVWWAIQAYEKWGFFKAEQNAQGIKKILDIVFSIMEKCLWFKSLSILEILTFWHSLKWPSPGSLLDLTLFFCCLLLFFSLQGFCVDSSRTYMACVTGEFCQAQHLTSAEKWTGRTVKDYATQKPPWPPAQQELLIYPKSSLGFCVVLGLTAPTCPSQSEKPLLSNFSITSQSQTTLLNGVNSLDHLWKA